MDGKLFGILMGIKDNIIINGLEIICVSKMLEGFVLIYEFIVMEKLYKENVVLIGKLNMDEFVMGGLIEIFYFKKIVNLFDYKVVLGGLLGGFVVVVVVGLVLFSLGLDIGGLIR